MIGVATRFGTPPQCGYATNKTEDEFTALPWNDDSGATLTELNGNDYQTRNLGGHSYNSIYGHETTT